MNTPARSFKELIAWQKAHQFVLEIYRLTRKFPSDEKFGLTSQIRVGLYDEVARLLNGYARAILASRS